MSDDSLKKIQRDVRAIRYYTAVPSSRVIGVLIVLGIAAVMATSQFLVKALGGRLFIVLLLAGVLLFLFRKPIQKWRRRVYIRTKYENSEIADRIINQTIWVGQTAEQLRDTFGKPVRVDTTVQGNKKTERWGYGHQGNNAFLLVAILEESVVTGWHSST